jgi:hypothetical protein
MTSPYRPAFGDSATHNECVAFDPSFAPTQLAARAAYLLRGNDLGVMTSAAPLLYPHMWSWDAAFVAVGLAPLSVERAVVELDTLLSAQWANGMIPHIVFANGVDGYFPGPAARSGPLASLAGRGPRPAGPWPDHAVPRVGVGHGQLATLGCPVRQRDSGQCP